MSRPLLPSMAIGLVATLSVGSCLEGTGTGPEPSSEIASVEVTPAQVTIAVDSTTQLTATVRTVGGGIVQMAVEWSSSAPDVAFVDQDVGSVRGVSPGTALISASAGGKTGSASVTVRLLPILN